MGPLHPASAEELADIVAAALGDKAKRVTVALGELTVLVGADDYKAAAQILRDAKGCQFEQLMDLCGVDYSEYADGQYDAILCGLALAVRQPEPACSPEGVLRG
jgi:NADH-quinone oxidoreductase subunit C